MNLTFAGLVNKDDICILANGTTPLDFLFLKVQVPFYNEVLPDTPAALATQALIHRRKSRLNIITFGLGSIFESPVPGGGRIKFTGAA